ncbi:hypothetical protein ACIQFP_10610 [Nocardiopsis alba]|uniref:phage terminase small subunit n=1 Tax=Nocardiopsis alba TaxID=53437 RepID=UPI00380C577C
MAGFGPPPSPNARRRNRDTFTGEGTERCPECGSLRREGDVCGQCGTPATVSDGAPPRIAATADIPDMPTPKKWLTATRDWWDAWTRSAQTAVFEPSDWETLKALLPLVDAMNRENEDPLKRAKLFDHIHKAEKALGGTHMERLRGRVDARVSAPGEAVAHGGNSEDLEGIAVLDEYREMLA